MQDVFRKEVGSNIFKVKDWSDSYPNVRAGFTTRFDGESKAPYATNNFGLHVEDNPENVLKNREQLAETLNIPLERWVMGDQIHYNHVALIQKHHAGSGSMSTVDAIQNTDGLFTKERNVLCASLFADCVPLYFLDNKQQFIAISHAGWKGTVANIAQNTIQSFLMHGSYLENIEVVIGPSICPLCYQVNERVINQIDTKYDACYTKNNGNYYLNLKQLNFELLVDSGLLPTNIHITNYCTYHDSHFFSHRRDQYPTGRMLGFIALT